MDALVELIAKGKKRPDASMIGTPKYERVENDHYPTEVPATEALIRYLVSNGLLRGNDKVLEPACGDGAITKVFEKHGFEVFSSDLHPQMDAPVKDFLTYQFHEDAGWNGAETLVVTNPPYQMPWINKFIDRINDMVHNDGVVGALLMRNELDAAKTRRKFFQDNPYYYGKLVLTWRPRWIPDSTGSPRHNYSWYIFADISQGQQPVIQYAFKDDG